MPVTAEQVATAAERIAGHVRTTPTLALEASGVAGKSVVLKLEHLQVTGTFKARGAFNHLLGRDIGTAGVIAASGGNHGIAVAYAGKQLGIAVEIFVPRTSSPVKVERLRRLDATVHQTGDDYAEALAAMQIRAAETGAVSVHAYDHPETIVGQATMTREFLGQVPDVDTLVIAVGGGGLIGGALAATTGRKRIIAVEPVAARALNAALDAGQPVDVEVSGLAADSLGARRIGSLCFDLAKRHGVESVLVADTDIATAQTWLWRNCRIAAEPGGAAAMAAVLESAFDVGDGERIGVVVCGANVGLETIAE